VTERPRLRAGAASHTHPVAAAPVSGASGTRGSRGVHAHRGRRTCATHTQRLRPLAARRRGGGPHVDAPASGRAASLRPPEPGLVFRDAILARRTGRAAACARWRRRWRRHPLARREHLARSRLAAAALLSRGRRDAPGRGAGPALGRRAVGSACCSCTFPPSAALLSWSRPHLRSTCWAVLTSPANLLSRRRAFVLAFAPSTAFARAVAAPRPWGGGRRPRRRAILMATFA